MHKNKHKQQINMLSLSIRQYIYRFPTKSNALIYYTDDLIQIWLV